MPFLSPNQQRQSAEGKTVFLKSHTEKEMSSHTVDLVVCVTASFPWWVWVGECFFWYRLTRVVPGQRVVKRLWVCVCACVYYSCGPELYAQLVDALLTVVWCRFIADDPVLMCQKNAAVAAAFNRPDLVQVKHVIALHWSIEWRMVSPGIYATAWLFYYARALREHFGIVRYVCPMVQLPRL